MKSKQIRVLITLNLDKDFKSYESIAALGQAYHGEVCEEYARLLLDEDLQDDIFIQDSEVILDFDSICKLETYSELLSNLDKEISKECNIINGEIELSTIYDTEEEKFLNYFEESKQHKDKGIMFVGYTLFMTYKNFPLVNELSPHFAEESSFYAKSLFRVEGNYNDILKVVYDFDQYNNTLQGELLKKYIESRKGEML
ncbi:hypothetical protein [Clostridium sp. YIM B02551]|uniref:hypothetical protein n=1 Tax=Clostridium sp. YIM B02551 TaxID=2910679 RepID=UPI001EEBF8F4|nr:hypothetical protein [Clostridium sp. YIM B02551]